MINNLRTQRMWYNNRLYTNPVVVYNCLLRQAVHNDPSLSPDIDNKLPMDYISNGAKFIQSCGAKDKNMKEIFEGDIYRTDLGSILVCEYDFDTLGFVFHNNLGEKIKINEVSSQVNCIGNIFENPDLVK